MVKTSRRCHHPLLLRRHKRASTLLLLAFITGLVFWFAYFHVSSRLQFSSGAYSLREKDWNNRREEIRDAFNVSWTAYTKYAWGYDRFHPQSQRGSQMSPSGLGWIIVDSLDTLMIMNHTAGLADARRWVSRKLDYDQDQDVNTFETTIRMLGGLLSAHYLSTTLPGVSSGRDFIYLQKAVDLADRLLGAYDSPSGIPWSSIDLRSGHGIQSHADGGASSTAEATTLQLEMKYLANLTEREDYWRKPELAMKVVDDNQVPAGLVPIYISADSGRFVSPEIRLGSRGDSYYEYLIKQYLQTGGAESIYSDMWEEAVTGIEEHLLMYSKRSKLWLIAELPQGVGSSLSPKMDHLVCFLPGAIALGATGGLTEAEAKRLPTWSTRNTNQMRLARELMKTCWTMYAVTATGLAPEIAWFDADIPDQSQGQYRPKSSNNIEDWKADYIIKPLDAHNLQRPETVESLFVMWRITKDTTYREWGWKIFKSFENHSSLPDGGGYTSLDDVTSMPAPQRDNMESFWLAETLKYLYLLFSPNDLLPLTEVVFNTEAHPLPIMQKPLFKTGWQRAVRSAS